MLSHLKIGKIAKKDTCIAGKPEEATAWSSRVQHWSSQGRWLWGDFFHISFSRLTAALLFKKMLMCMFKTRCPLGCLTTICFERCWRASSRRAARWRMTETRSSLSSPSAPQTSQVLSAWPSSGANERQVSDKNWPSSGWYHSNHRFIHNIIFLRIIGLEESASSCRSILEPSFNNQVIFHFELGLGLVGRVGLVWIYWLVWLGCEFEVLIFLASGDDDIGPRHDLHHVPNYHHQIIDQIGNQYSSVMRNAFFKIIFSRSWERSFCNQTNKIILFSQNLHCFGIHRVETDKRHPQIHSLSWSPSRSGCTQNSFLVELLSIAPIPKLRSHPDARLIWNNYSFLQLDCHCYRGCRLRLWSQELTHAQ